MTPTSRPAPLYGRTADGASVRITIEDRLIAAIDPAPEVDSTRWLVPGLVDLQVNGFAGADVNADSVSVATITTLTRSMLEQGVTSYCPTIVTASADKIINALEVIAAARAADPVVAHCVVGVHIEGPYLSAEDGPRGAHDAAQLRDPDPAELDRWLAAAPGLISIVTLAPERSGAEVFIRAATAAGIVVAVGHTAAEPEQIRRAVAAGATLSTHLGNGAHPVLPRHPNYLWTQLADERLNASLIADGRHLPEDTVIAMIRAKGPERVILISDAVALAHRPPGDYRTPVGGTVTVAEDGALVLAGTGLQAGSGSSLLECLLWADRSTPFGWDRLVPMATAQPARLLGLRDRGELTVGAVADILVLGPDRVPEAVLVAGEPVTISNGSVS